MKLLSPSFVMVMTLRSYSLLSSLLKSTSTALTEESSQKLLVEITPNASALSFSRLWKMLE